MSQRGRRFGAALALTVLALGAVLAWRTWRFPSVQPAVTAVPGVAVDGDAAAARLGEAIRLPTVAQGQAEHDAAFAELHALLARRYPRAHAVLQRETIGRHALLYRWPGRDARARPVALMAHQDVVPVAPGTEADWVKAPFSGAVHQGEVWGRGAWDDKGSLMAMMEAVELLAASGFQPRQTVYLVFGADEELGGNDGARRVAERFRAQGLRFGLILDEGLLITHGMVPGVRRPVALLGVAQKGYLSVRVVAQGQPGHSSQPGPGHAIGVLAQALTRLEANPLPARMERLTRATLEAVAPEAEGLMRVVLSNLWLTAPLVERQLAASPASNAMLRTTAIPTVLSAGERDNVVPGRASAVINLRLLPGDRIDQVVAHLRQVVQGLPVTVEPLQPSVEASPVSAAEGWGYRLVARTLRELQPDVVVAPGLLIGGADSVYFSDLSDTIVRFRPLHARKDDLARFHGSNERISVDNHVQSIQFYERLIRRASEQP